MTGVVGILAWYSEGREFDSREMSFEEMPDDGAVMFKEFEEAHVHASVGDRNNRLISNGDWYYLDACGRLTRVNSAQGGSWAPRPDVPAGMAKRSAPTLLNAEYLEVYANAQAATW